MPQKRPSQNFNIHVDPSCLTSNSRSLAMMATGKRNDSDQTVLHHTPSRTRSPSPETKESEDMTGEHIEVGNKEDDEKKDVAEHEDKYKNIHETLLSRPTSMNLREPSELSHLSSLISTDSHTEALIQAAARAVVASMEEERNSHDNDYGNDEGDGSMLSQRTDEEEGEDSILSQIIDENYAGSEQDGTEHTYGDGTELTYSDETERSYDSDPDGEGHDHDDNYEGSRSASSHHDDDVFSSGNSHSHRSSLNSISDPHTDQETHQKQIEPAYQNQDESFEQEQPISRIPSGASQTYSLHPMPLALMSSPQQHHTPSKVLSRPPFRTPSSVRALQMTSPTPSIFSSPRSAKRPTVSRLGTPQTQKKTPTRFKFKKEHPLILLHVTVLPLHWTYSAAIENLASIPSYEVSPELAAVAESWRLLKEKTGDVVLDRGVLLAHPQDEYEVLEERLLEALELPVRPRAKILSCGHYLGIDDDSGSDMEFPDDSDDEVQGKEKWCDICDREVHYENFGLAAKQKRFRVKVYASNGLMTAGSWLAAWREMEKVDVEIEPLIPSHLVSEMDSLLHNHAEKMAAETQEMLQREEEAKRMAEEVEVERRRKLDEERMREIYGHPPPSETQIPEEETHARELPQQHPKPTRRRRNAQNDSLPELLLAAVKVALQDRKNILILILSIFVVFLVFRPAQTPIPAPNVLGPAVSKLETNLHRSIPDIVEIGIEKLAKIPEDAVHLAKAATGENAEALPVVNIERSVEDDDLVKKAPILDTTASFEAEHHVVDGDVENGADNEIPSVMDVPVLVAAEDRAREL